MINKNLLSLTLLLLLGLIWGTGYSIARFATTNGVPPLGYSFWQSLGPAVFLGLMSQVRSSTQQKLSISTMKYYLICGLTGIVIPNTNMYFASPHLPAGLLAVIVNIVPIIAYCLALVARLETFNLLRFSGIGCALAGLMLIIIPKTSLPSPEMIPWIGLALLTPLSFAISAVYIARFRPEQSDSFSLAANTLITSSLILLPFVFLNKSFYYFHFPFTFPDWVVVLEIILSSVGYILFFQLLKVAGPVYYSLVDTIVALTGLFWGYILFHEKLTQWISSGVFLIFIALLLVTKRQQAMLECPPSSPTQYRQEP